MWNQAPPPASPYGSYAAPQAPSRDSRLVALGVVCIVLAILKLLWVLYEAGSAAVAVFAYEAMLALLRAAKVALPALATKTLDLVEQMVVVAAVTTAVRMLPFAVLTIVQLVLGVRLQGSDRRALSGVRKLAYATLAALFFGLLLQVLFVVPTQLELLERLVKDVFRAVPWPGGRSPVGTFLPSSPFWAVTQPILVTGLQALWPMGLLIWAHQLRDPPQPPAGPWQTRAPAPTSPAPWQR